MQYSQQVVADGEDLFGVGEDAPPRIGELQIAPGAAEEFHPKRRVEFAQLGTDGVRGEVQLLGGARDAAGLGNHPEISQMLEVECGHVAPCCAWQ